MNRNYSKELEKIINDPENIGRTLLLHSCCAPCSSYVLEYLRKFFKITVFYFNPNITEDVEYQKRVEEQKRLIAAFNRQLEQCGIVLCDGQEMIESAKDNKSGQNMKEVWNAVDAYPIDIIEGDYCKEDFFQAVKGLEQLGEGSQRCFSCFRLRLKETAKIAKEGNFDYFTTTLTISPLKNAAKINEIGEELAVQHEAVWLPSDFKKKNGYKRSVELSAEYGLYRQDYCGCIYSKLERQAQKEA